MATPSTPSLFRRAVDAVTPASMRARRARAEAEAEYYRLAKELMPTTFESTYNGVYSDRASTPWTTSIGYVGANHPLNRWRLTKMRDRARDLERNNAIACGMLDRAVENVVSHGFALQANTGDEKFDRNLEGLWEDWTAEADIRGMFSWPELQKLVYRAYLRDGDVGAALVSRPGKVYRVQPVEGDFIDTLYGGYDLAKNIMDGIQYDTDGRPLAFNLLTIDAMGKRNTQTVSAANFVFLARHRHLNGTRGEPCFAQTFRLFDQMDGYIDAVVMAARVAACQALVITKQNAGQLVTGLASTINAQGNNQKVQTVEPGSALYLNPGEDAKQFSPQQPTQSFPDFVAALLRLAGVTLGLPLELVLLDFSRTNYSSARAALLQAYRTFRTEQRKFMDHFLSRIYLWRLSKWVADGDLVIPRRLEDKFTAHKWIAPGWAWVDPEKEISAALMSVDAGLDTLTNLAAQHGRDFLDMVETRKREIDAMRERDIPQVHSTSTRDADEFTDLANAYGVGVRAGVVTPNLEDETLIRSKAKLPPPSEAVKKAWESEGGVRQPITLQQESAPAPTQPKAPPPGIRRPSSSTQPTSDSGDNEE